mmetsp:Transcript_6925/g.11659  ORF Transcript_6925/g.11659 Transcript_6925/m.11659 type:complete len:120 (-) Transcript_6925:257-616(-)
MARQGGSSLGRLPRLSNGQPRRETSTLDESQRLYRVNSNSLNLYLNGTGSLDSLQSHEASGPVLANEELSRILRMDVNTYLSGSKEMKQNYTKLKQRFLPLPSIRNPFFMRPPDSTFEE